MARRPARCLLPLLAAALLAGCGGASGSSSSSRAGATAGSTATLPTSSTASTATSSTASTPTRTATTSSTGTSTTPAAPAAAAVASCKRGVRSLPHLKQSTTERLETICEKAASGDVNAKRKAAEEACRELVNASPLPAGEAKERALAACRNAGGAKGAGAK